MRLSPAARRFLVACALTLAATGLASADNWPQWRGPNHDGVSHESGFPTEWSETKNLAWKLPMPGMAGSTPVVWGDRIFLTSEDHGDLVLLCVSDAGKELWKRKLGAGKMTFRGDEGNGASASPSTDGKHVYAFVVSGDLGCFDLEGTEAWRFNIWDRYGQFRAQHGFHSSPLLDGDRIYLQLIHSAGAWVIAIDKATGKEVWKVARKSDAQDECLDSYASPTIWRKGKEAYLITHGGDYAIAHRLDDGSEIWRLGGINPKERYNHSLRLVASPLATPDLIVVPSAKHGPVVGLKPDAAGRVGPGSSHEQWRRPKNTPDVPSPMIYDGLVYLCGESGILQCLDVQTGQEHYSQQLHRSRYRASPVAAGGMIYLTARDDGTVTVVKAGPKFEQVAVNKLPDRISASPALAGGRIYLRGYDTLFAVGSQGK